VHPRSLRARRTLQGTRVRPGARPRARSNAGRAAQVATMTNGSVAISEGCLARAGLAGAVAKAMDVTAVRRWKPAREVYAHAARELGLTPDQARPQRGSAACWWLWRRRHARGAVSSDVGDDVVSLVDSRRRACWGCCHSMRVLRCSGHGCMIGTSCESTQVLLAAVHPSCMRNRHI